MRILPILFILLSSLVTSEAATLYFPRVQHNDQFETGIALTNTGDASVNAVLTLFDARGAATSTVQVSIAPHEQFVGMIADLVSLPSGFQGWMRIESDGELQGMGILLRRADGMIADAPLVRTPSKTLYFNHVAVDSDWQTDI